LSCFYFESFFIWRILIVSKSTFACLLLSTSLGGALAVTPAVAQETAAEATATTNAATEAAPVELTVEQVEAQNKAVADFGEAQQLQAAGDHAGALAKLDGALPTIRVIAGRDPTNIQNAGFLASALTMAASSHGALGHTDQIATYYAEAVPHWRKVYDSDPSQAGVRDTLIGLMINLGNYNLINENKIEAKSMFDETLALVKAGLQADPASPELANAHFSALIGLNQSTGDESYIELAKAVGEELRAKGIVNAMNEPSVNALLGAA
jgi:tetratricopeptide (TPR) repeat protein